MESPETPQQASPSADVESASSPASRLLSLPPELRAHIFSYVLADVRCRRPIVVWDNVCMSISTQKRPVSTAILHASRTTYEESSAILYDTTTVEVTIRSDEEDQAFPRFQRCLGLIEDCALLSQLRHIELEVSYKYKPEAIERASSRLRKLAGACTELKTIHLTFYQAPGFHRFLRTLTVEPILAAAQSLRCERFSSVSRNGPAASHMTREQWMAFKTEMQNRVENDLDWDRLRELAFEGWFEHDFRLKN